MAQTTIRFKTDSNAIRKALDVVRIVTPPSLTQDAFAGFLFVVGKKVDRIKGDNGEPDRPGADDGKDFCWIYSRDAFHVARSEFQIHDVEGEGAFIYPSNYIDTFKYVDDQLAFEIQSDEEAGTFFVRWGDASGRGSVTERASVNPKLLTTMDKNLEEASNPVTYPKGLLLETIRGGKAFLASDQDRTAKDEAKVLTIYDQAGKGDGVLQATDGYQRFYFKCDELKGKGLQIHSSHVSLIEHFLSKCGPDILVVTGNAMTYAMTPDKSRVLGWAKHTKPPADYKPIPESWDKFVVNIKERDFLLRQIQYVKSEMEKGRDKIKIKYDAATKQIRLAIVAGGKTTSMPIDVEELRNDLPNDKSFEEDVNIDWLQGLFKDVKARVVEFRMFPMSEHGGGKGSGFRTVDEYWLNHEGEVIGGNGSTPDAANGKVYQCKVTRFMPSKM